MHDSDVVIGLIARERLRDLRRMRAVRASAGAVLVRLGACLTRWGEGLLAP